jgi:hypothetical protein
MAMTIFLLLNGLGVVFLVYVLANFWNEGRQPKSNARKYASEFGRRDWINVVVVAHPISHNAQGGLSVIPFRVPDRNSDRQAQTMVLNGTPDAPVRRFSTK